MLWRYLNAKILICGPKPSSLYLSGNTHILDMLSGMSVWNGHKLDNIQSGIFFLLLRHLEDALIQSVLHLILFDATEQIRGPVVDLGFQLATFQSVGPPHPQFSGWTLMWVEIPAKE